MPSDLSNPFLKLLSNFPTMKLTAPKSTGGRLFLPAFFLIVLVLFFLASLNELRFDSTFIAHFSQCALSTDSKLFNNNDTSSSSGLVEEDSMVEEEVRILIGILTLPDNYNRRHFLRLIYGTQILSTKAKVDIKFVFCNLTKEDQKILIALEIMRYDDILILNCKENMNNGKTYTYFSSLPSIFDDSSSIFPQTTPPYHYVMKADDDTYFRLDSLIATLRPLPRQDLYYGYVVPCPSMDPFKHYMSGMGYLVSWDLVKWISESDIPRTHMDGPEDKTFGEWMRVGRKAKNRFNAKWSMYDYPEPKTGCTHELWNDTVAVHRLKSQEKWIKTLKFFNVTKAIMFVFVLGEVRLHEHLGIRISSDLHKISYPIMHISDDGDTVKIFCIKHNRLNADDVQSITSDRLKSDAPHS